MSRTLLFTGLLALGVSSAPTSNSVSTSVSKTETCITRIQPASTSLATLPTSTRTSAQTKSTTVTVSGSAQGLTTTVTPETVTSYEVVNATGATGSASTTTLFTTITAMNASSQGCSTTKTVTAAGTTTVYTGSYNGTVAKRTASPQDGRIALLQERQNPIESMISHLYGQSPLAAASREPFEVDCLEQVTTYLVATSTLSASALVETVTAIAPTIVITSTKRLAATTAPSSVVTITSTVTAQATSNATGGGVCTVSTGTASATTTQHIKCAPTNLITEVNGYGIGQTEGHANETQGLAPGSDPSACCQLCVDTENCAASEDDQKAGNCFLWYTSSPTCGLGFKYTNGTQDLAPGAGFSVQTGCGTIEASLT